MPASPPETWSVNTAGEGWSALADAAAFYIYEAQFNSLTPTFTLTSFADSGVMIVQLDVTIGGSFSRTHRFAILTLGPTDKVRGRDVAMQSGINYSGGIQGYYSAGPPTFGLPADAVLDAWDDFVSIQKTTYLGFVTDATVAVTGSQRTTQIAEGVVADVCWLMIQDNGQVYVTQDALRRINPSVFLYADAVPGPEISMQQPPVTVLGMGALVDAVNAITDQDFEIEFNNRAFVFSVKAKVLVG